MHCRCIWWFSEAFWKCEEEEVKTQQQHRDVPASRHSNVVTLQRRDVRPTEVKVKEQPNIAMSRLFHDSCIIIIKSTRDPIFEVLSDVQTRSGTRSRSDPRDRKNSCFCISLLKTINDL